MDAIAEKYVKVILALGEHDDGYIDAYYGPKEWQDEVKQNKLSLEDICKSATELQEELITKVTPPTGSSKEDEMSALRYEYLKKQLKAVIAYAKILKGGEKLKFVEEAQLLYDITPEIKPESHFVEARKKLDALLGGDSSVPLFQRYADFKKQFIIPKDKLSTVFEAAIAECKKRTANFISLPQGEDFKVEYVNDKPWSGYNWYKGNSYSLIQVNTDLPIFIDRAVDLAAHEGYPGHHVFNSLLEENLVKKRKFVELSIYPLFSPQSLIAEGTANFGIKVAFPGTQQSQFEREVLYPLAGLDPNLSSQYSDVQKIVSLLSHADNLVAQQYLDGVISRDQAVGLLSEYSLAEPQRAAQRLKFIEKYRSYVINYNIGKDMVEAFINSRGGTPENPEKRWTEFAELISSPRLPSGLVL